MPACRYQQRDTSCLTPVEWYYLSFTILPPRASAAWRVLENNFEFILFTLSIMQTVSKILQKLWMNSPSFDEKLRYRRGTARRAVSVEIMWNIAQMFTEVHLISPSTGEWPQGHPRSPEMARSNRRYDTSCQWCVVTTCLSCTISLILPLLRCTWLPVGSLTLKSVSFSENSCD